MGNIRKTYLDVLRVVASFAVMIIHISSQYLHAVEVGSYEWITFRAYLLACNWAVPVFCMISGSIFLSKDIPFNVLVKKNISKMIVAFATWSFFYALVFERQNGIMTMLVTFVRGYSHLWFLYMIIGLYLVTPLLRCIAKNDKMVSLFVALGVVFTILVPEILSGISLLSVKVGSYLSDAYGQIGMQMVSGYALYFMMGHYLNSIEIKQKSIPLLTIGVIVTYLFPVICNSAYGVKYGKEIGFLMGNFSVGDFVRSCCIFLLFRIIYESRQGSEMPIVLRLATYSFGAYLLHQMVITLLNRGFGLNTLSFNSVLAVPVIGVITFLITYIIVATYHSVLSIISRQND